MHWLKHLLSETPLLALFASLAIGYLIGKIPFGPIKLGGVCGTLIAAIVIGQLGVSISDDLKTFAFALFIYALGYTGGPAFFSNLNRKGLRFGVLTIIEVVTILALVSGITWVLQLDRGTSAGLLAGAATESAVVGTASDALAKLGLPASQVQTLQANVATTYTISYLFGLVTIVLFTSQLGPMILRINLREEAKRLWERLGGGGNLEAGQSQALPALVGRVYAVSAGAGRTIGEIERGLSEDATVEVVRRGEQTLKVSPELRLAIDDAVLVVGQRTAVVNADDLIGPEREADGIGLVLQTRDVVVTNKQLNNQSLGELRATLAPEARHGVYVGGVTRMDTPLPSLRETPLQQGDVVTVTGAPADVDRVTPRIGYPAANGNATDFIYLGLGLTLGLLIGMVSVKIAGVPMTLGTGGGALVAGLVFGWARAKHPTFGAFPSAAAQVIKDLGLASFIAVTGLSVGSQAWTLLDKYGVALPICGILIVLVPASISLYVGHRFLKLDAPVLFGGIAGQQCSTPAISSVLSAAGNSTPLIGYTVTYALSNVVLPLLGPLMVGIAGRIVS